MIFFTNEKLHGYINKKVEEQVCKRLKELEVSDVIIPSTNATWVKSLTVKDVIKNEIEKVTDIALKGIKDEFEREEFINSVVRRINEKQLNKG